MKKLNSYIQEQEIIESNVDESILAHLAISYKENNLYSRSRIVLEKYGIYEGCEELAQYVYERVKKDGMDNQYTFTSDELKSFKNIFFKTLIVDIDTSENAGGQYLDNEELNGDLLFDEVNINIYLYENRLSEVKEILMHELTHAYNNYIMCLKGDNGYINAAKSLMYKNIQKNSSNDNEFLIKKALYLLLGYEKNAFFAQIKAELENHKEKIKNPYDALKVLKKSKIYIAYNKLNNEINSYFDNTLENKNIDEIEKAYLEITGEKKTADQIFKTLRSLSRKTLKKLDTVLPKLCIENLNNVIIHDDKKMFQYLNN